MLFSLNVFQTLKHLLAVVNLALLISVLDVESFLVSCKRWKIFHSYWELRARVSCAAEEYETWDIPPSWIESGLQLNGFCLHDWSLFKMDEVHSISRFKIQSFISLGIWIQIVFFLLFWSDSLEAWDFFQKIF